MSDEGSITLEGVLPGEWGGGGPSLSVAAVLTLDRLDVGVPACVVDVVAPDHSAEWARWLQEIGFIPGEPLKLAARGPFGGDPLVIRIGDSTFALRRAEAACIRVQTKS